MPTKDTDTPRTLTPEELENIKSTLSPEYVEHDAKLLNQATRVGNELQELIKIYQAAPVGKFSQAEYNVHLMQWHALLAIENQFHYLYNHAITNSMHMIVVYREENDRVNKERLEAAYRADPRILNLGEDD